MVGKDSRNVKAFNPNVLKKNKAPDNLVAVKCLVPSYRVTVKILAYRSINTAIPCPPPIQAVTMPRLTLRRFIS